jgi:hypothetical protein
MSTHTWEQPARYPRCLPADSLYRTGQALFNQLPATVTPETIAVAQDALAQYRAELLSTLHPMHFGVSVGIHICVEQVYQEGRARLRCLAVTSQPAPEPPPPPPPKPRTLADAAEDFFADTDNGGYSPVPPNGE